MKLKWLCETVWTVSRLLPQVLFSILSSVLQDLETTAQGMNQVNLSLIITWLNVLFILQLCDGHRKWKVSIYVGQK